MYSRSKRFANPRSRVTEYLFGFSRLPRILMTGTLCAVYPISRAQRQWAFKPNHTLLGSDVAGEVEAVGNAVTRFRPGDEVFGFVGEGGFAEYVSAPERLLALKPTNLSFEQAATVPLAAVTALQGLRDAGEIR